VDRDQGSGLPRAYPPQPVAVDQQQLYGYVLNQGVIMKYSACAIASAVALTACNQRPEVDLHDASANQVIQAVQQSGMMKDHAMIEPGLWKAKVTVHEMNIPGMPAQYAAQMKQEMVEKDSDINSGCLTAEDIRRRNMFGVGKSCRFEHFTMGGGKMDSQMACGAEGTTQTTTMSGTYTPTSYSIDVSSTDDGGDQNSMSMKLHIDANRVGECTAKKG
jgi:hypothetical protein